MSNNKPDSAAQNGAPELSPEQARQKRAHFLALAAKNVPLCDHDSDQVDAADSTMATLILPGG